MTSDRAATRIESLCEGVIEAGWLLALGTVLLVVNTYSERSYEPEKAALVRSLAILVAAAWAWKVIAGGRVARPWTGVRTSGVGVVPTLAAMWAALLIGGSILSVDPRLSWVGSYARAQGALTELAYLTFFAAILTHLRTEAQWRRIALVMVVAGSAASLYGVAQAVGLDPINGMRPVARVHATAGNAIFLGACLLMTIFVTAHEWARARREEWSHGRADTGIVRWRGRLRTAALALACASQLAALVLTQSRGPFLGLLAAMYVGGLALLLRARARSISVGRERGPSWAVRWLVPAVLAAVLLGMLLVVVVNRPETPLSAVRGLPYLGRLSSVLDPGSRTLRVRLLIWRAVTERLASAEPLEVPGAGPDRLHRARLLIGYGPETFGLAVNRFVPPELGQVEDRGRVPDRAHNDTFDRLVMNGLVGGFVWLAILASLFVLALGRLGLAASTRERLGLWMAMAGGATIGAAAPWLASGEPALSGVGLSVGFILSVAVFVTLRALVGSPAPSAGLETTSSFGLTLALLATLVAHLVELQVGIAITFTRLSFWCLAAVLIVVAGHGLEPAPDSGESGRDGGNRVGPSADVVTGLLAVSLCLPWLFTLTISGVEASSVGRVLLLSWWGRGGTVHPTILVWLVAATLALSAVMSLAPSGFGGGPTRARHAVAVALAVGGLAVAQAALLFSTGSRGRGGGDLTEALEAAAGLYGWLTWCLLALTLVLGVAIASRAGDRAERPRARVPTRLVATVLLGVAAAVLIQRKSVDPIRADGLLKSARALTTNGRFESALELLAHARELAPREPMYALVEGRAALAAAAVAANATDRKGLFGTAEASLEAARRLAPLDPDHWANLARCAIQRARATQESDEHRRMLKRAGRGYAAALHLRPMSVLFLDEYGRLLLYAGRTEEGERVLRHAEELDPLFVDPLLALAALEERRAAASFRAGDREATGRHLELALAQYEQVLALDPEVQAARDGVERVTAKLELERRAPSGKPDSRL